MFCSLSFYAEMPPRYATGGKSFNDVTAYIMPFVLGEAHEDEAGAENDRNQRAVLDNANDETDLTLGLNEQVIHNQGIIEGHIQERRWTLQNLHNGVTCIVRPTASGLFHNVLNPNLYHRMGLILTLDAFAIMIGTPVTWKEAYIYVKPLIQELFDLFRNLPDYTSKSDVQAEFQHIVSSIAIFLRVRNYMGIMRSKNQRATIVGGILAHSQYDVRSSMDALFVNENDIAYLASEVKTEQSIPGNQLYYRGTRGTQAFVAMFDNYCPTMILTPKKHKVIVENSTRDQVYTYPSELEESQTEGEEITQYMHSTAMGEMNSEFIKIIVISLMAARPNADRTDFQMASTPAEIPAGETSASVKHLPEKRGSYSNPKVGRKSARLSAQGRTGELRQVTPTFVSGYDSEGNPIRSEVRVYPPSVIEAMENEIAREQT
jgi:hypothetical protein